MSSTVLPLFALCLTLSLSRAEDATGAWKWSFTTRNGDKYDTTLKAKQEGEKLTGKISVADIEIEIKDGKVTKDGDVSFAATFEREGNQTTAKFKGKLKGDTITGTTETERDGNVRSREWIAQREGAAGKVNLAGKWRSLVTLPEGDIFEMELRLEQAGNKVAGGVKIEDIDEIKIDKGEINDNEISWTTMSDRDGRAVTSRYKGKIEGDKLVGKIESDYSGEFKFYPWEARRK